MAFSGEAVTINLGQIGLLTDVSPVDTPPGSLIDARNVTFFNGMIEKAPGTDIYNQTPFSSGVVALFDWWPDTTKQRLIAVTANGSVYRDEIGGAFYGNSAIKTGLGTLTPNCTFVSGGIETAGRSKKLFLFTNGVTLPQVLTGDGTALTTLTAPSVDWATTRYPKVGVIHQNRLWVFSGQSSYASNSADHEDFVNATFTDPVFPGEGGEIIGAYVFKGRLFAFKDGGFVYYLDDSDTDSDLWSWRKLASNFGLAAPNAICEPINDLWAGNTQGTVTSYAASDSLGEVSAADIFKQMQIESYVRGHTNRAGLTEQHALYYPEKKQAFFTYRSTYKTENDMLICVDVGAQNPRTSFLIKGKPQCLALRRDVNKVERPIYGDADGNIHFMDYADRLEGSTAYEGKFQLSHMDFRFADGSLANKQKLFSWLAVTYVPQSTGNLTCEYLVDGKYIGTVSFPMVQYNGPQLDELLLSVDRLGEQNQETFTRPIPGFGRTLSLRFYNSGANENFQIASITVGFRVAGEQAQKTT